jgi:asparagine synthase (glutamine-hydrolysing)
MCGINGIFAYQAAANPVSERELLATRDAMARRGPDGHGEWWTTDRRVAFGHRRLSIIDLSDGGRQPMLLDDGALAITFNGEIYNHVELRQSLEKAGRVFLSNSDTEVLLHLYAVKGEAMVEDLRGMYAFAIWDGRRSGLFLARDPYGIKPLYTSNDGWTFRFASQVKALIAGGGISQEPEPAGIVGFHLLGSVPEPFTLYRDVRALPAGHTQWVDTAGPRLPRSFVNLSEVLRRGSQSAASAETETETLVDALRDSVRAHMVADVDIGVFLSAGVDSGALLGLMQHAGRSDITAITLSFAEFQHTPDDEAPVAAEVARQYCARHVISRVTEQDFRDSLPTILSDMDQPSIDGINTWLVARAAKQEGLKVALSGLGADELLGGYPSFRDIPRWVAMSAVPGTVPGLGRLVRKTLQFTPLVRNRPKLAGMLEYGGTYGGAYLLRRGIFLPFELRGILDPEVVRIGLRRLGIVDRLSGVLDPDPVLPSLRVSALESSIYLRNQLLRDADWAGMAHGVEIRTPYVDIRLLEKVARCLPALAQRGKSALAKAPSSPLPDAIVRRAKTGFMIPTQRWLRKRNTALPESLSLGLVSREWASEVLTTAFRSKALRAEAP